VLVASKTSDSLALKSNGVGKVRGVQKWVSTESSAFTIALMTSSKLGSNSVGHVSFALSLETASVSVAPVGEASGEGSEETAGFLVRLFKDHAIIISLDLDWSSSLDLLLLLEDWLLNLLDLLNVDSLNWADLLVASVLYDG